MGSSTHRLRCPLGRQPTYLDAAFQAAASTHDYASLHTEPALDVAASWIDPVSGLSIRQLALSLRSSPASIVLVSTDPKSHRELLERAASESQSQWIVPEVHGTQDLATPQAADHRWIGLLSQQALQHANEPLVIFPTLAGNRAGAGDQ